MKFNISLVKFVTPLKIYIFLFLLTGLLIIGMSKNNKEDYESKYNDPYYNRYDKINNYQVRDIYL